MISSENLGQNYNFESKPNVPKFNGQPGSTASPVNRATDRIKSQQHEELRRRASYQKVLAGLPQPIDGHGTGHAGSHRPSQPQSVPQSHHEGTHRQPPAEAYARNPSLNEVKIIKQEAPQTNHPSALSTDDSDEDRMSPNQTPVVQIATAPSEISQSSQPVQLNQPSTPNLQYSNVNSLQNQIGLPSYNELPSSAPPLSCVLPYKYQGDMDDSDQGLVDREGLMEGGPVAMVEEAARKREVRLLKNREAARECRRKKKEYINNHLTTSCHPFVTFTG